MIKILGKIFESNPENSIVLLKDKCSDCGRDVAVNIIPTSGGFGLRGGALFKNLSDGYLMKCPDCCQTTSKIDGN